MKNFETTLAEAIRIEYDQHSGKLYIVFEVVDEKFKRDIKTNWIEDIEYRLVGKKLVNA